MLVSPVATNDRRVDGEMSLAEELVHRFCCQARPRSVLLDKMGVVGDILP
jgi:hypothetical protein